MRWGKPGKRNTRWSVFVRLTEAELQRVIDDLPQRAREHIRVTTAHKIRHLGE
jgi:hypothetical protein